MTRAFIGLGSNLGDREANLRAARSALERRGVRVAKASSIRETEPFGVTEQPLFLNQALLVDWEGAARTLLTAAKEVEAEVGRTPTYHWGPREIDVDLLLFGRQAIAEADLTIPHPGLRDRVFALEAILELDPELEDPVSGEPLKARLEAILES